MDFSTSRRTSTTRSTTSSVDIVIPRSRTSQNNILLPTKRSSPRTNGVTSKPPATGATSRSATSRSTTSPSAALNDDTSNNATTDPFDPYTYTPHTSLPPITPRPSSQPPIDATVTILDRTIPSNGMPLYRLHIRSSSPGASEVELLVPLTRIGGFVSSAQLEEFENGIFRREGVKAVEREREALNGAAMRRLAHKNGALEREGEERGVKRKRGPGRPPKKSYLVQAESTEESKSTSRTSSSVAAEVPRRTAYVEVSVTPSSRDATTQRSEEDTVKAQRTKEGIIEAQQYAPRSPQPLKAADPVQRSGPSSPPQPELDGHMHDDVEIRDIGVKSSFNGEVDDIEDEDEDELALPATLSNRYPSAPSPRISFYPSRSSRLSPTSRPPRSSFKTEISETSDEDEIEDDEIQNANSITRPSQQLRQENNSARLPIRASAPDIPVANRTGCPQHPQRRRTGCKICHPTAKFETWRQQLEKIKAPPTRLPAERGTGAKLKSGATKEKNKNTQGSRTSLSKPAPGSNQVSQPRSLSIPAAANAASPRSRAVSGSTDRSPAQTSSPNNPDNILDEGEDISEGEYEIEAILSDKLIAGERSYFVKWLGYDYASGSWMRESDLTDAEELVAEYLRRKREAGVESVGDDEDDDEEMGEESEEE
ncbi:hypothetical protein W97_05086 [Coniosporium apollinis CBS 100218]|uniref:Chromo domain-containing protein n=1 Tax=Coniosporium apollinis (strain CBS 100218) TaxID=1168221 RepID=R7YVK4_CONA1|nr:uncharacterized protein W97_05086 [Coniosporium apollinis CBS 100218]EON65844.1 hypothetical protein W97_05086 [Coniosporium apollinis CBS 100218]